MNFCLPGVQQAEKEDSDSDPEVVAARAERKRKTAQEALEAEKAQEVAAEERRRLMEEVADKEQVLQCLCPDRDTSGVLDFMRGIDCTRPEDFDDRLRLAGDMRQKAKTLFQESDTDQAVFHWLCAVHCLDFTPAQQCERTAEDRRKIIEGLTPVLGNLSLAIRKLGDPPAAIVAANVGLEVIRKLPFGDSKEQRVKLYLRRALARGDARNFAGASEDAGHILQLHPGHGEATCIRRNAGLALRREGGPEELRWRGPIDAPAPKKARGEQPGGSSWCKAYVMVLGPALALGMLWLRS